MPKKKEEPKVSKKAKAALTRFENALADLIEGSQNRASYELKHEARRYELARINLLKYLGVKE